MCEERGFDGSTVPRVLFNSVPHFQGSLRNFQGHFQLWNSSLLSLQAVSMQIAAVLSLGMLFIPHSLVPNSSPCPHSNTHLRLESTRLCYRWSVQDLFCLACHRLATALSSDNPSSISVYFATSERVFLDALTSPFLQFPHHNCESLPFSSFLFLLFLSLITPG